MAKRLRSASLILAWLYCGISCGRLPCGMASLLPLSNNNGPPAAKAGAEEQEEEEFLSIPLIPHHVHQSRRNLQPQQQQANEVAALYQGYGSHYVDLWCGTPPQRQTVIVDTGSTDTAFPCSACSECGASSYHADSTFQEHNSSTFHKRSCSECQYQGCHYYDKDDDNCAISAVYAEGSMWMAYEATDVCYVGGLHNQKLEQDAEHNKDDLDPLHAPDSAFRLGFGCQTAVTGLFKTQLADGIMGMGIGKGAFWKQMYRSKKTHKQAFSLCYSKQPTAERKGTTAGAMTLGGVDPRLHKHRMVSAEMTSDGGYFGLHIQNVYLRDGKGGESVVSADRKAKVVPLDIAERALNQGGPMVDSGTTNTYLPEEWSEPFQAVWKQMTGQEYTNEEVSMTEEEMMNCPTLIFQFRGDKVKNQNMLDTHPREQVPGLAGDLDPDRPYDVLVAVPPTHYFQWKNSTQKYSARIYMTRDSSVFGGNFIQGHDVHFDHVSHRMGWAESDCDYTNMVQSYIGGGDGGGGAVGLYDKINYAIAGIVAILVAALLIAYSKRMSSSEPLYHLQPPRELSELQMDFDDNDKFGFHDNIEGSNNKEGATGPVSFDIGYEDSDGEDDQPEFEIT